MITLQCYDDFHMYINVNQPAGIQSPHPWASQKDVHQMAQVIPSHMSDSHNPMRTSHLRPYQYLILLSVKFLFLPSLAKECMYVVYLFFSQTHVCLALDVPHSISLKMK